MDNSTQNVLVQNNLVYRVSYTALFFNDDSPPPGFVPFSTANVGPTVPLNPPADPVPEAFPLRLLNQLTGF